MVLALVALIVTVSLARLSKSTEQHLLIASEIAAIVGALAGIASVVLARGPHVDPTKKRLSLVSPHLLPDDELVDRTDDMNGLLEQLERARVVNCHGHRGSGKSFLLGHLADVVNGHRPGEPGHPTPREVAAALYFDLADAAGFEQIQAQVSQATLGTRAGSWPEFIAYVDDQFTRRSVLLILDNMNTPGLWPSLGKAAHEYLANRANDRIVFGSIEPVTLLNLQVQHMQLCGLDLKATAQLVAVRGGELTANELADLHTEYDGLPLYTCLVTAQAGTLAGEGVGNVHQVLDAQFIKGLAPGTRKLLSFAALLALVERQVPVAELEACRIARLDTELVTVNRLSLMTPLPEHGRRLVKIHDIVRDTVLEVLATEVSEAANLLFRRACQESQTVNAALYAMFADPYEIGASRFDETVGPVIRSAVSSRNHALLTNLHLRASQSARILEFIPLDKNRADLFAFGRASELAGLGRYSEAQEALLPSSIVRTRWNPQVQGTDLQADLRFLQADIAHLLNRYDEAAQMFEELGEWAAVNGRPALQARCIWGHGHVLRHQGRDLETALALFADAARLADAVGELFPKAYSITGASGIRVLTDLVPDDEEQLLAAVEHEVAADSAHDGYMLEVWKSQALLAWHRRNRQLAIDITEAAIERALARNDRLLYNLYFERAEYYRFCGEYAAGLDNYRRVLEFGSSNGDRNLISNALLGVVLLELSAGRWLFHDTCDGARASVLRARKIAIEADIQITARIAETVAAMLDDTAPTPDSIRLIVL
jgi:tetratricopeptide (TPR) repeat protein